jgi:hypothetical protein
LRDQATDQGGDFASNEDRADGPWKRGNAVATLTALVNSNIDVSANASLSAIESVCSRLFDDWCERRALTPLCYLLHAWPLTFQSYEQLCRLYCTLRELLTSEPDCLLVDERWTLQGAVDILSPFFDADRPPQIGGL